MLLRNKKPANNNMKTIITSLVSILLIGLLHAGGSSHNAKIVSLTKTSKDRYTMIFDQLLAQKDGSKLTRRFTLRLRHNDDYCAKKSSSIYTIKAYREAVEILKKHAQAKDVFRLGSMGSWGIPVKDKKDEFWVQTIAVLEEFNGAKVVYTLK